MQDLSAQGISFLFIESNNVLKSVNGFLQVLGLKKQSTAATYCWPFVLMKFVTFIFVCTFMCIFQYSEGILCLTLYIIQIIPV